jgi:hypothetical protein
MNIYHFQPTTGRYLGQGIADADPLTPDAWLLPAHCTQTPPPSVGSGFFAKFEEGAWQTMAEPPAPPEPTPPTLAELKASKNTEINVARLTANRSTFAHAGKVFSCDELSRGDIESTNGFISLNGILPPGWPGGWKAVDNTYTAIVDIAAWKSFYASMFSSGMTNFAHAQTLKAQLAAATTANEVAAIVW